MNIHFVEKKISNPIRDAFFFDVVVNSNALEYMYVCTISKTSIVFSLIKHGVIISYRFRLFFHAGQKSRAIFSLLDRYQK